jgi:hypothetical protein
MNQKPDSKLKGNNVKRAFRDMVQLLKKLIIDRKNMRFLILLVFLGILVGVTLAQQTFQQGVSSYGTIRVIGASIFWDNACKNKVTSITWGAITPGTSVRKYVYVRNDGTVTGILSMSYGNWTPATAASYLAFAWNCSNYALSRSALVCAELTLVVQPNITGVMDFSFTILIQVTA